jgi:hypothetical protein
MLRIEIHNQEFNIHQDVNQLSRKTLVKIADMTLQRLDESRFKLYAFLALLEQDNSRWKIFKLKCQTKYPIDFINTKFGRFVSKFIHIKVLNLTNPDNAEFINSITDFFFSRRNDVVRNPIPRIYFRSKLGFFSGPSDYAESFTFGQFWQSKVAFLEYQENPSADRFQAFITILYPRFRLWFFRLSETKSLHFWRFVKLSPAEQQVILWYYSGVLDMLISEFPNVFQKSKSKTINVAQYQESWLDILDTIAGSPKEYDNFNDLNVRYVLRHLDKTIRENREQKEYLEAQRKK